MPGRHLHTSFLLLLAGALWAGCTAETASQAAPSAEPSGTTSEGPEEEEEENKTDAGSTPTRDAGKPKKDAAPLQDAGEDEDAGVIDDAGTDSASCWPFPCSDAASSDAAPKDSGAACNNVPVAVVTPKAITGSAPSLGGGALVDGVYKLTASSRYISGTSGTTFPAQGEGVTISGSTLQVRITAPGFGVSVAYSYTFTAAGNKLTLTRTCPSAGTETWTYDVDGTTLVIHGMPQTNGIWYQTFERQ